MLEIVHWKLCFAGNYYVVLRSCGSKEPMGVLRNCQPKLSYILAELFNKCQKESCFPDCWKVSSVAKLSTLGKSLQLKTTALLVFFLWLVKSLKKLVNSTIVGHLEKRDFRSDFQYGVRSSRSTADLLTAASGTIARAFNRSEATRTAVLNVSNAFDRVCSSCMLVFFTFVSIIKLQVRYLASFLLFSVIDGFE